MVKASYGAWYHQAEVDTDKTKDTKRIQELEKALEFYANEENWKDIPFPIFKEWSRVATEALGAEKRKRVKK